MFVFSQLLTPVLTLDSVINNDPSSNYVVSSDIGPDGKLVSRPSAVRVVCLVILYFATRRVSAKRYTLVGSGVMLKAMQEILSSAKDQSPFQATDFWLQLMSVHSAFVSSSISQC